LPIFLAAGLLLILVAGTSQMNVTVDADAQTPPLQRENVARLFMKKSTNEAGAREYKLVAEYPLRGKRHAQ
jgi:hypothetical protein